MMQARFITTLGLAVVLAFGVAIAEDIDASKPLACKLSGSSQCNTEASCIDVTLAQIDLTEEFRIDFENRQLAAEAGGRTSPVGDIDVLDGVVVLQGHQNGRGWTIVIDRKTGFLSAALAETAGAFVISGSCTVD